MGKTKTKTKARSVGDSPKPPITIRSTNPKVIDDNIAKLEKAIKGVDEASEISYDNTGSGLSAENVQSAIDEIVEGLTAPAASDVTYDNTSSGLVADDVQTAIDELSGSIANMNTWESITLPTPTVSEDGKTRTYAVDLSGYKYLRITVGHASTGGTFETDFNCVGDTIRKYYQVSGQVESYAIVTTTSNLLIYTETQSTHEVAIKSLLALK